MCIQSPVLTFWWHPQRKLCNAHHQACTWTGWKGPDRPALPPSQTHLLRIKKKTTNLSVKHFGTFPSPSQVNWNIYTFGTLFPFETTEHFILTVGHETDEDEFSAGQTLSMSFNQETAHHLTMSWDHHNYTTRETLNKHQGESYIYKHH